MLISMSHRKVRSRQMPHSLRAKLGGLRYKGILEDKDYKRLCKALDNEDVLDKIRAEIEQSRYGLVNDGLDLALKIIDKYVGDSE